MRSGRRFVQAVCFAAVICGAGAMTLGAGAALLGGLLLTGGLLGSVAAGHGKNHRRSRPGPPSAQGRRMRPTRRSLPREHSGPAMDRHPHRSALQMSRRMRGSDGGGLDL